MNRDLLPLLAIAAALVAIMAWRWWQANRLVRKWVEQTGGHMAGAPWPVTAGQVARWPIVCEVQLTERDGSPATVTLSLGSFFGGDFNDRVVVVSRTPSTRR